MNIKILERVNQVITIMNPISKMAVDRHQN